jgi:hypothetical protein
MLGQSYSYSMSEVVRQDVEVSEKMREAGL